MRVLWQADGTHAGGSEAHLGEVFDATASALAREWLPMRAGNSLIRVNRDQQLTEQRILVHTEILRGN